MHTSLIAKIFCSIFQFYFGKSLENSGDNINEAFEVVLFINDCRMCQKLFLWAGEMPQFLKGTLLTKKLRKSQGG